MNRLPLPVALLVALALAAPASARPGAAPGAAGTPAPPEAIQPPAPPAPPAPDSAASPAELRDRQNLVLERNLKAALRDLHVEGRDAAFPSLGFGLLAAGGAYWVASETDARGTWAVILGHVAAGALTDAVILGATPDPGSRCRRSFETAPSDTPAALADRVALGERCLEATAQREASLRLTRGFRNLALGAATVALWGTEAPQNRDRTLVWIAIADGVFGLAQLVPSEAERRLAGYREDALDVRLAPAPAIDTAGRVAPGLGLAFRL